MDYTNPKYQPYASDHDASRRPQEQQRLLHLLQQIINEPNHQDLEHRHPQRSLGRSPYQESPRTTQAYAKQPESQSFRIQAEANEPIMPTSQPRVEQQTPLPERWWTTSAWKDDISTKMPPTEPHLAQPYNIPTAPTMPSAPVGEAHRRFPTDPPKNQPHAALDVDVRQSWHNPSSMQSAPTENRAFVNEAPRTIPTLAESGGGSGKTKSVPNSTQTSKFRPPSNKTQQAPAPTIYASVLQSNRAAPAAKNQFTAIKTRKAPRPTFLPDNPPVHEKGPGGHLFKSPENPRKTNKPSPKSHKISMIRPPQNSSVRTTVSPVPSRAESAEMWDNEEDFWDIEPTDFFRRGRRRWRRWVGRRTYHTKSVVEDISHHALDL